MEAFERHLREKFKQWRLNVRHLSSKQDAIKGIFDRLGKRYKRLALNIYKKKVAMANEELKDIKRGNEARIKL